MNLKRTGQSSYPADQGKAALVPNIVLRPCPRDWREMDADLLQGPRQFSWRCGTPDLTPPVTGSWSGSDDASFQVLFREYFQHLLESRITCQGQLQRDGRMINRKASAPGPNLRYPCSQRGSSCWSASLMPVHAYYVLYTVASSKW